VGHLHGQERLVPGTDPEDEGAGERLGTFFPEGGNCVDRRLLHEGTL
jgi:hypothetical protein